MSRSGHREGRIPVAHFAAESSSGPEVEAKFALGMFSDSYPDLGGTGGVATYTRSLALALTQLGVPVHVLTGGLPQQSGLHDGVHLHCIPVGGAVHSSTEGKQSSRASLVRRAAAWCAPGVRTAWLASEHARRLAAELRLPVFEFPNWGGPGAFFLRARRPRTRLVVRMNTSLREVTSIEQRDWGRNERFRSRLERRSCLAADALVCSTRAHRAVMARELGLAEDRIQLMCLGLPEVDDPAARTVRPRGHPTTVVFLGRLEKRKGVATLLAAMPALVSAIPDLRLVLIGDDLPHAPGGRSHRDYWNHEFPAVLRPHVEFSGRLPDADVQRWFSCADLFVAPSLYESFGLIFVEAMRWSLPVVGTRVGGIPEVVEDGRNGLLVAPDDPLALANAMIQILGNEEVRRRMGAAARATFEERFTSKVMARNALDFYRRVAAGDEPLPVAAESGVDRGHRVSSPPRV